MPTKADTVEAYLKSLPADRQAAINAVRAVILANLPKGYAECMSYGMIGYVVPHSIHPEGYHCNPKLPLPYTILGSQKNHMVLHLMMAYGDPAIDKWFRAAWLATGKKLDMGKGCLRFKKIEDVPLAIVGKLIARVPVKKYIERMNQNLADAAKRRGKSPPRKTAKAK